MVRERKMATLNGPGTGGWSLSATRLVKFKTNTFICDGTTVAMDGPPAAGGAESGTRRRGGRNLFQSATRRHIAEESSPVANEESTGARLSCAATLASVRASGGALLDAHGDTPYGARPFGEGLLNQIMKLVEDYDGDRYRAAYTVAFQGAVYVLDVEN
jgi:hypothetical protein